MPKAGSGDNASHVRRRSTGSPPVLARVSSRPHALRGAPSLRAARRDRRRARQIAASLRRSEEHTSELQSLMRISYAVFCLKKKKPNTHTKHIPYELLQHTKNTR